MKIKFHNVGFGPGGKPIFPKTATIPRRKLRVESVKRVNSPKKINKNEETEKTRASSPKPTKWRFRSSSCSPSHRKRNCQNGRSPYKFYPAQQGENLVHLRGWLPLIKQIAEEIGMDYMEKRSPTKVFAIVSKLDDWDVNKIIPPVRLICDAMGFYHLEVFLVLKQKGHFKSEDHARNLILKLLGPNSNFVVCGGIIDFDESGNRLGYDPKHLRKWEMPFKRVVSDMCEVLHEPKKRKRRAGDVLYDVCNPCKKLHLRISRALR